MTLLAIAIDTEFQLTAGKEYMNVRSVGGGATLLRKNDASDPTWTTAAQLSSMQAEIIWSPVPGSLYKFAAGPGVNVRASD